ncbi:MAG: MoaD/ThiS family protein [Bacteroidota bacterium]
MAVVQFTSALNRFFPSLQASEVEASTIAELLHKLEDLYPGIRDFIVEEDGSLRQHVNIFIANELIQDRTSLKDELLSTDEVFIFQALSGG